MATGKVLHPFDHALKRPDTYIGSVKTVKRETWVHSGSEVKLETIPYNPGLFNIIREIGSNCIDNKWRSETSDPSNPMKKIEITFNSETGEITFRNDGYEIPIEQQSYEYQDYRTGKTTTQKLYPAEVFFGEMLAGTNFDDDAERKTSGRNGMGAKAANVFSTMFTVEHVSSKHAKKFVQTYTENGKKRTTPKVTSCRGKGYTSITFTPDYAYFGYSIEKNSTVLTSVLRMYAHEIAMITGVIVTFNKERIVHKSLEKYARLFYPSTENKTLAITAPIGDECVLVETGETEVDSLDDILHLSFVNGIRTKEGGVHVDTWRDSLIGAFVRAFNARKPKKGSPQLKTTAKEVFPYLTMFLRCEVDKPSFDSQTKDRLNGPENYVLWNTRGKKAWTDEVDTIVKKMLKWNFVTLLEEKLLMRLERTAARKEGGAKKRIAMGAKADDANKAGTAESHLCTLYITEGLSAKAFAIRGIGTSNGGRDYNGAFAIKGKFLNVQNATIHDINNNEEVQLLKKMLGLRKGVDYSKEANFKTLRYGKVRILADADDDGIHIRGLLLNFFYTEFRSLIERDYVESFSTAVVQVTKGKSEQLRFYSNPEFKGWYRETGSGDKAVKDIKYLKGLGSINPKDAPSYFEEPKVVSYYMEGDEHEYMDLGFNDASSDKRKVWITRDLPDPNSEFDEKSEECEAVLTPSDDRFAVIAAPQYVYHGRMGLSTFVDQQLIIYHRMVLRRALPCVWDGFKESQRKVFFAIRLRNYKKPKQLEMVMGAVKEETGYHHGGASLADTAIKMAQGFVGSNNIPLLVNDGEFGTRVQASGSDAAAPRYISTMLEEVAHSIFPSDDDPLLTRLIEDDDPVEFAYFMPVLPMILVNGAKGVASGYSTDVPCYNPLEIVEWIRTWISDPEDTVGLERLKPWYRGFIGSIELTYDNSKDDETPSGWISRGILEESKSAKEKGWWHIREAPIKLPTSQLKEWIEYLETGNAPKDRKWKKCEGKYFVDVRDYSTANTVHFMVKPSKDFQPDMEVAGNMKILQKPGSLRNMVLINEHDYPIRFDSAEDILEYFCPRRLRVYEQRKKYKLGVYTKELTKVTNKFKFVTAVIEKKIDLYQPDEKVEKSMIEIGLEKIEDKFDYLLSMQMRSMTLKKVEELKNEIGKLESDIQVLKSKSGKDLWLHDLDVFEKAYAKFLKTRCEEAKKTMKK